MIAVQEITQAQERQRSLTLAYTAVLTNLTSVSSVDLPNAVTNDGFFTVALANVTPSTFTVTATAAGDQAQDACATFSLNERGVKGYTLKPGKTANCWR